MNATAETTQAPPQSPGVPQTSLPEQASHTPYADEVIPVGDRVMLYLLVFFFGFLGLVILLDLVAGFWWR